MDELISKRELLERYGISYGALYRWKRLKLIPEEWFIKKATVTGQETFFKREQICQRVERILNRGENLSLEELAQELAGQKKEQQVRRRLLVKTQQMQAEYSLEELTDAVLTDGEHEISILEYLREVTV